MKFVFLALAFIGALFITFREEIFGKKNAYNKIPTHQTANISTTPLPAEKPLTSPTAALQQSLLTGWIFDHKGVDTEAYDWFIPATPLDQPTEWFIMRGKITFNTTYRVKTDCVIEFMDKDDHTKVTGFWKDSKDNKTYLRLADGSFSKECIGQKEFAEIRMQACQVRFLPAPGKTLSVLMGRKE